MGVPWHAEAHQTALPVSDPEPALLPKKPPRRWRRLFWPLLILALIALGITAGALALALMGVLIVALFTGAFR